MSDTFEQLRRRLDGSESFMTSGHQIIKVHQGNRQTPIWARSNRSIGELLLRAFPKLQTDTKQRLSAARWANIIQLHFRALMSYKQTAEQMGVSYDTVECTIRRIRKMAATPSRKHRGRPKK